MAGFWVKLIINKLILTVRDSHIVHLPRTDLKIPSGFFKVSSKFLFKIFLTFSDILSHHLLSFVVTSFILSSKRESCNEIVLTKTFHLIISSHRNFFFIKVRDLTEKNIKDNVIVKAKHQLSLLRLINRSTVFFSFFSVLSIRDDCRKWTGNGWLKERDDGVEWRGMYEIN